ncbi:FKBP-type peptidyl-prolyl cis-trans isomerase [Paracidobacterium acidisoli]|uniref:Peptidyl-prolyl cis-trans isomerase n=1 Tax=Paracidobacterium acidisoli TaxID=2303751 RepID=A0A372IQU8_9BACT|nr:FKBP-type peptidyl-prolyl cis-trans isomerase [Paracidobacterium acidisoli]MBT9331340.1 FKBP-type peptidyl-prolyl cis-trans isomerase [Paracidobacterium acidisoli]
MHARWFAVAALLPFALAAALSHAQTQTPPAHHTAAHATHRAAPAQPPLPKNIPPVHAPMKVQYVMRYQDITLGTGALAGPGQIYTVHYTGWLASDGTRFDSSLDRGKPIEFLQGSRRVIIGWDQGFEGMHIGGKRRLFIPWQLAYGAAGRGPIPPKADLIFDIELVDARDVNAPAPPPAPPAVNNSNQ